MEQQRYSLTDFRVGSLIGRGAYSFVYRVRCRSTGLDYAMKIIDKAKIQASRALQRVLNEISIQSEVRHRHIVSLVTSFEDDSNFYLVLELCHEGELFKHIRDHGRLREDDTRRYCGQILSGLSHLHEHGILHRDLKLSNVLLSNDRQDAKIADFGLAVRLTPDACERQTLCGTPNYLSPELVSNQPYSFESDVWAFGCILYACLVGSPPFESESVHQTLRKVKTNDYRMPRGLSGHAKDLLSRILELNPGRRITLAEIRGHPFFCPLPAPSPMRLKQRPQSAPRKSEPVTSAATRRTEISQIETDCSYCDYMESIVSPVNTSATTPDDASVVRKLPRIKKVPQATPCNTSRDAAGVTPLNLSNLPPFCHNLGTTNGYICIDEKGWLKMQHGRRTLEISENGLIVYYNDHLISLRSIRSGALKLYTYAEKFINVLRSKTPKHIVELDGAVCMLMQNTPNPNFEVNFDDGGILQHKVGSKTCTYKKGGYQPQHIDLQKDRQRWSQVLETFYTGLRECMRLEGSVYLVA